MGYTQMLLNVLGHIVIGRNPNPIQLHSTLASRCLFKSSEGFRMISDTSFYLDEALPQLFTIAGQRQAKRNILSHFQNKLSHCQ